MTNSTLALAFTAGMVATFNPCGFSLLPAYLGAFVAGDHVESSTERRLGRAAGVSAAVAIGFVVVFSSVGYASTPTAERSTMSGTVKRYLRVTTTGTFSNADFIVATRRGTAQDDVTL